MIVDWKGRTWGTLASGVVIQSAKGIEDLLRNSAVIAGGRNGAAPAPSFSEPGAFTIEAVVLANTPEAMAAVQDDIKAATWTEDPEPEDPFTFTIAGQAPLTIFARVASRLVDTDFTTSARGRASSVPIAFDACDPMPYGPEVTEELAPAGSVEIGGGWASTMRWTWTVTGPCINPRLKVETDGYPNQILRYVGSVPSGKQLVVESGPSSLTHTLDGAALEHGDFDGGTSQILARFPKLLPGQTVSYIVASGSGGSVLSYWPARP